MTFYMSSRHFKEAADIFQEQLTFYRSRRHFTGAADIIYIQAAYIYRSSRHYIQAAYILQEQLTGTPCQRKSLYPSPWAHLHAKFIIIGTFKYSLEGPTGGLFAGEAHHVGGPRVVGPGWRGTLSYCTTLPGLPAAGAKILYLMHAGERWFCSLKSWGKEWPNCSAKKFFFMYTHVLSLLPLSLPYSSLSNMF